MQRGSIEHEQIIYESSNRRMKQLIDWLSKLTLNLRHRNADLPPLSNGTQANGDHSCPVQHSFKEVTSHQLDWSRPTEHVNFALTGSEVHMRQSVPGANYLESSKPTHLLYLQPFLFS